LEVAVTRPVGVAVAFSKRVGAGAMIVGGWVDCLSAMPPGSDVAVTTMIHGVCVGGTSVGSGATPQPASQPAHTPARTSSPASFFIV
jgi:hypothetical protein